MAFTLILPESSDVKFETDGSSSYTSTSEEDTTIYIGDKNIYILWNFYGKLNDIEFRLERNDYDDPPSFTAFSSTDNLYTSEQYNGNAERQAGKIIQTYVSYNREPYKLYDTYDGTYEQQSFNAYINHKNNSKKNPIIIKFDTREREIITGSEV